MNKPKIFVIMPFEEIFFDIFNLLKNKFGDIYNFSHAGDLGGQQSILKDIVLGINEADIILADLSFLNPNVFYELGLAHAMNKKVIIITQCLDELPFDLRSYRANSYDTRFSKIDILIDKLSELLSGAIDKSIPFGNPVSDYLPKFYESKNTTNNISIDQKEITKLVSTTKDKGGFIDYICDLGEGLEEMENVIGTIAADITNLGKEVCKKADQLQKDCDVSKLKNLPKGRKILREVAKNINDFSLKFKSNNHKLDIIWTKIENNFLYLLENQWLSVKENKKSLVNLIKSLIELKENITSSKTGINELSKGSEGIRGLERSLDSAILAMNYQIELYNNISDNAIAIIDRIYEKSKILN